MTLFVVAAAFVTFCMGFLFILAMLDVYHTKRDALNGPIQFMNWNNARHQFGLLVLALFFLGYALKFYPIEPVGTFTFLCLCGAIDALCSLRYRRKMAEMVGQYMGMRGGRRKTDPCL